MQTQFEVIYRSIRVGSLKTNPPKDAKKLKFSMKGLRFYIETDVDGKINHTKIAIPVVHIVRLEGYLGRGCPVIWIKTDPVAARKIRQQCGMKQSTYPVPNFDPESKELADQRIAVIPANDPIEERELIKFRTLIRIIAHERNLTPDMLFNEQERMECNEQLVQCTRYISDLKQFQRLKLEKQENEKTYPFAVKSEFVVSTENVKNNDVIIVLSSDEDDEADVTPKTALLPITRNDSDLTAGPGSKVNSCASSSDDLPVFDLNHAKANSSTTVPSLESITAEKQNDISTLSKSDESTSPVLQGSNRPPDLLSDANSGKGNCIISASKHKMESEVESPPSAKKGKISEKPEATASPGVISLVSDSQSSDTGSKARGSKAPGNVPVIRPDAARKNDKVSTLPGSKIDVRSIRGTASLTPAMETLHQDMESMLSATPLCICVVKSQYAINFSSHKITCMAIDNVNGRLTGCINLVTESHMMRPSKNLPAHGLCSEHMSRMVAHECCPGCGTYCAGGTFLVCNSTKEHQHRFHRNCLILMRHTMDCPHCGCPMSDIQEIAIDPSVQYLKKFEYEASEVVEKSPEKRKQPCYPSCVVRIPGITKPVPENLLYKEKACFRPDKESLDVFAATLEEELPKKLRFQPKSLIQLVKQGDLVKTLQLLCGTAGNPDSRNPANLRTALHEAVLKGNLPMAHLLVTVGASVNLQDENGKTPLFYAQEQNRLDLQKYLIASGTSLTHSDSEGMVPLHHAAREGKLQSCLTLLKYGKKAINFVDEGGWTPLVWAAEHKRAETARSLVYFDADMHTVDKEGNICLQWAALAGNIAILLMCLRRNSNVDHQNTLGDTALHIAAREDNRECVVILLAWGANPLIKNREGNMPSQCAKDPSMCQVALLMNAMTRMSITDHKGFEPLDRERLLSTDISRGKERIAISCVNAVDEAPCPVNPPHEFLYIAKNLYKYTCVNAIISNTRSCKCIEDCVSCECSPCWYDASGRLLPSFNFKNPPPIYECNPFCKCLSTCRNRVIQKAGIRFRIQVFRTPDIGWGVRTLEVIPRGSFVCEYIGEVISNGDAREDDFYLFDLEDKPGGSFCIDGRSYGNVSRYINHHCEPNLVPIRFFYSHQDKNYPRIAFFANKDISPGQQLSFDYGDGFWDEKCEKITCECGAASCRYSEKAYRRKGKRLAQNEAAEDVAEL